VDDDSWTGHYDGLCFSLLLGAEPGEVVRSLCPPDLLMFPSAAAAAAWVSDSVGFDRTWLATGKVGDWTFVWEDNGFQGADPHRAASLAAESTFVSMFWNVNSLMSFTLARDGQIVRQFDPLFHDDDPSPVPAIGDPLPDEADLDWETEPRLSGLTLLSRLTGTEPANPVWLDRSEVSFWGHTF